MSYGVTALFSDKLKVRSGKSIVLHAFQCEFMNILMKSGHRIC